MINKNFIKNDLSPLLKLALPLVLTGIIGGCVGFFETLFLAHVSHDVLAAGALVSWLYGTFFCLLFGSLSAMNILISNKHGAQDKTGISLVMRDGLFLAICLTIPSFLLFWNMAPVFILLGQKPYVAALAQSYLHALCWGLLPNFIAIALFELLIGLGETRILTFFTVFCVSLIILFSYVLIFGKCGFPALGIAGAGWGMTISYWIIAITLAIFLLIHKEYKKYFEHIFNRQKPSFIWELIRVGVPMGAMYCIEVAFFFALTLVMGSFSSELLAANQIVLQYLGALTAITFSVAQAITVRMGHLLGAKEIHAAKKAGYSGIYLALFFIGVIAICYWSFPSLLISLDFNVHNPNNLAIVSDIKKLLAICAVFQIFEAMRISLFGVLRALKDTSFTLLISIISFWCLALPVGYLFATYFRLNGAGLWWGMVIGAGFSVCLLLWRFQSKINQY
ncbi:MAG: MATE family efflux transporter [Gammaproteobacteria bacterium]|nr:MATE family efflux transporter [Gammaproteobacteria bacterium]